MKNEDIIKLKNNFDRDGYVLIKNFYSNSKIKYIKRNLFKHLEKIKYKLKKRQIHFTDSKLINSVHHLKWKKVNEIRNNKKILNIVKILLTDKIKHFGAEVFAKPAKYGLQVPIHQDNFYWNVNNSKGLTVWIALDKSIKKNGAIFYYKKTHKIGLLNHKSSFAPGSSQKLKNLNILKGYKKTMPILNAGDILIHHCLVVHGSMKNSSNKDRTGLTMRYIGKSSKILKSSKSKYEKELKKQLIN